MNHGRPLKSRSKAGLKNKESRAIPCKHSVYNSFLDFGHECKNPVGKKQLLKAFDENHGSIIVPTIALGEGIGIIKQGCHDFFDRLCNILFHGCRDSSDAKFDMDFLIRECFLQTIGIKQKSALGWNDKGMLLVFSAFKKAKGHSPYLFL